MVIMGLSVMSGVGVQSLMKFIMLPRCRAQSLIEVIMLHSLGVQTLVD